jgi:hypothetical protein
LPPFGTDTGEVAIKAEANDSLRPRDLGLHLNLSNVNLEQNICGVAQMRLWRSLMAPDKNMEAKLILANNLVAQRCGDDR